MKKRYTSLVILNTLTLIIMLFANYAGNAGIFSNQNAAGVSHQYDTLFAPAGYAFAIWGFIFLLLICFVIYQWILLKKEDPQRYIQRTGIWFTISNIANAAWLYCWTNEWIGWSVICILLLLCCLVALTIRLRLELDDEPVRTILFVWFPIVFYLGWMLVATIACIASWLVYTGWQRIGLSQNTWAIIMIAIACLLYLMLTIKRNMREAAVVGIWAFIAIALRRWNDYNGIAIAAVIGSVILLAAIIYHANKNRFYGIGLKMKRGEW